MGMAKRSNIRYILLLWVHYLLELDSSKCLPLVPSFSISSSNESRCQSLNRASVPFFPKHYGSKRCAISHIRENTARVVCCEKTKSRASTSKEHTDKVIRAKLHPCPMSLHKLLCLHLKHLLFMLIWSKHFVWASNMNRLVILLWFPL